jgi:hypothetical protein
LAVDDESSLEGGIRFVVTDPGLGTVEYNCVEEETSDDVDLIGVLENAAAGESARTATAARISDWNIIAIIVAVVAAVAVE